MNTDIASASRKLSFADILDHRAYERFRALRQTVVFEIKRRRRISLGTMITVMFENREMMQAQIQEMLRVENVLTDEGVLEELKAYNPLIPEGGQLSATLLIELTSDAQVSEWLPKLVGIERTIALKLSNGEIVKAVVEEAHAEQLTRENVTAAVHYIRFEFSAQQVENFARGSVQLVSTLPNYIEATERAEFTVVELPGDLQN